MEATCKGCGAVYGFKSELPDNLECFGCEGHEFDVEE